MSEPQIVDNTALHRFELRENGETAFLLYSRTEDSISLIHTEVPHVMRGRGLGSKLVGGALRLIQPQKLTVIPSCPFVVQYLKNHPQYNSIVAPEYLKKIQEGE
jgi:uncharacterized protein